MVVTIDFENAFDIVGRQAVVRASQFHKCDLNMIYVIVYLYMGGRTEIWGNVEVLEKSEDTSEIRQGSIRGYHSFS